ncbi:MAG TPA: DUF374 domain-containing protein, partial [Afifellaceae bacterium]|nr:DUF374 domain-containing protein [Afifellaceae bacterium]
MKAVGLIVGAYLIFARKTTRYRFESANSDTPLENHLPVIITFWHGQHFLVPMMPTVPSGAVLISRSPDGEINAVAARMMGLRPIRGS